MPTMWKGAIGFGLVSIPVELQSATGDHDIHFRQVHIADGGRVRNRRRCEACGQEVPQSELAKGYEEAGRQAVLTDEDLETELPLPSKRLIDVLAFIDTSEIDATQYARSYYVAPQSKTSDKPYVLLRDTMAAGGKAAIAKVAVGTRESLALLRVKGDVLLLHTLYWPDELRDAPRPAEDVTHRPQELTMMAGLMDRIGQDFNLDAQQDTRQKALKDLVEAKLHGTEPPRQGAQESPRDSGVADLMTALQASMDATEPRQPSSKKAAAAKKTRSRRRTG